MTIEGILFSASSPERARLLLDEMTAAGWTGITHLDLNRGDAHTHVRAMDPAAIVLDLGSPDGVQREQAFRIASLGRWPVVIFVDHADGNSIEAAVAAGVSGYVVRGLVVGRVQSVVETAMSRFRQMERLRRERDEAVSAFDAFWCPVGR